MHFPDRMILSYGRYVWVEKEIDSNHFNGINITRSGVTEQQKSYIYTHYSNNHYIDFNTDVTDVFDSNHGGQADLEANILHFYDKTYTNRMGQSFVFQRLYGRE